MLCAGCTSARPAQTPVIVANACPKVSLCPMPGSDPETNGDLSADIRVLSFEKRYTLNVIVTDFTGDFDLLIVPVLAWLRENQPDIMTTDEGQKKGFTFYADINNDSSFDISISLMLTERTLVSEVDGALHVKNIPEPPPPEPVTRPMELYINRELVSKWDE
ncbi:Rz1-like lysis system protein LysC [Escherichia coli]|uniref:Rz1-like lysis system protein LysC n=3 Tax=Escherichia coli TaxID=562 RepID=UPI001FCDE53C|nr:Rz1-like lysis system protein LysC [Escherichia coli]